MNTEFIIIFEKYPKCKCDLFRNLRRAPTPRSLRMSSTMLWRQVWTASRRSAAPVWRAPRAPAPRRDPRSRSRSVGPSCRMHRCSNIPCGLRLIISTNLLSSSFGYILTPDFTIFSLLITFVLHFVTSSPNFSILFLPTSFYYAV